MKSLRIFTTLAALALAAAAVAPLKAQKYTPSPENVENRKEFVNQRFGIFLHWGIYASYAQGEWYLQLGGLNKDEYAKAASAFYPAKYDARKWVEAFKDAGAEYVTITSRHHDGFSMYDSDVSDYNIVDATPWGKDIMKDLAEACREQDIDLHMYYSILDWIREDFPLGESGRKTGREGGKEDYESYLQFMKDQVAELIEKYSPRALWFDGYWDHKRDTIPFDWRMEEFYEHIHSIDPACMIGNNHHILPIEGEDFQMFERDLPGQNTAGYSEGQEVSDLLPLEMCQTMNHSWGYCVSDLDYKTPATIIRTLAKAVSMNTNLLLNIGPQANGELPGQALSILKEIGAWMRVNGEAIKGCGPGPLGEQQWGVTTAPLGQDKAFYLHMFEKPESEVELPKAAKALAGKTVLAVPVDEKAKVQSVSVLGGEALACKKVKDQLYIALPDISDSDTVISVALK